MNGQNWIMEPRGLSPKKVAERNLLLRMAAKGAVNGTAIQWPVLKRALMDAGFAVTDHTPANMMQRMAEKVLSGGEDYDDEQEVGRE